MRVAIVVGNPKPRSRTREVAERLVENLLRPGCYDLEVIDLADHANSVFDWSSEALSALTESVAASDLVIFASPTYKATYTGLLKGFLDRYPAQGLAGVTAIPLLTGADATHSMGPEVNLSPLLRELGAVVPGRAVYFITSQMGRIDEIVQEAAGEFAANIARLAALTEGLRAPAAAEPSTAPTR